MNLHSTKDTPRPAPFLQGVVPRLDATRRVPAQSLRALAEVAPLAADRWKEAAQEMPEVGDEFLDFELIDELGKGAFGRVFLARQADLADRLVALKLSADLYDEPEKLARLQHTAIMPIYSTHRGTTLQAVCMPFYGRSTLADLCQSIRGQGAIPSSGQHLISTLASKRRTTMRSYSRCDYKAPSAGVPDFVFQPNPTEQLPAPLAALARLNYIDAILLTASRIAEGLAHAHERGILHLDLKPANILLTDEGLPMILDFNLARDKDVQVSAIRAQVGGTIPFMSPEQLYQFQATPDMPVATIDERSDLYSLGLILYQLLTGVTPARVNADSLRELLGKLLADRRL